MPRRQGEKPRLFGDAGLKHHLQQVAKLVTDVSCVIALDGVRYLVGFSMCRAIVAKSCSTSTGTGFGITKASHDVDDAIKLAKNYLVGGKGGSVCHDGGPEWNDAAFWRFWEKSSTPVPTSAGSRVVMLFPPLSWLIPHAKERPMTENDAKARQNRFWGA